MKCYALQPAPHLNCLKAYSAKYPTHLSECEASSAAKAPPTTNPATRLTQSEQCGSSIMRVGKAGLDSCARPSFTY